MGGTSQQSQQSQTVSQPWQPAQGGLLNLINQIQGQMGNTGINPTEAGAFNQLQTNANAGNPYAGQIGGYANNLLGGGGANAQAGNVGDAYATLKGQLMPWASGAMGDPANNPALRQMLDVIGADTRNSINSQFAGAGRDLSGMNQQAIARGLAQGEAPVLLNAQQMGLGAANNLYNAGNTTSGILSGMNQTGLANQGVGVSAADQALQARNWGANQTLNIQQLMKSLPVNSIGALAQLLVPIAGLGGQTNSNASGSQTMSGAQQFGLLAGGLGSLFGGVSKSDRWTKTDVVRTDSKLPNGLNIYRFRYKGETQWHEGLMADEVAMVRPEAVKQTLLHSYVDYSLAVR